MNQARSAVLDSTAVPRFGVGVRFRYDQTRAAWVLLAPERMFVPDAQAVEVLKLVDGSRSLAAIVDSLAARYAAPAEVIAADVAALLQNLSEKGAIRW
ncbi:MAG: pyrroloquinoline quinone biosynthesis peptide chaperone PqqD [Nevskia sp.]|nr:pyrroloquinoline quinone biosynthesis peptide chaperone PqqD [Nevskia sp.]